MKPTRKALFRLFLNLTDEMEGVNLVPIALLITTLHKEGWEVSVTKPLRDYLDHIGNSIPTSIFGDGDNCSNYDLFVFDEDEDGVEKIILTIPEDKWCIASSLLCGEDFDRRVITRILCLDPSEIVSSMEETVQQFTVGLRAVVRKLSGFIIELRLFMSRLDNESEELYKTLKMNIGWLRSSGFTDHLVSPPLVSRTADKDL